MWKQDQLETINCDFCGGDQYDPVITRPDGLLAITCKVCGLCYINPRPKSDFISGLYDEKYFEKPGNSKLNNNIGYPDHYSNAASANINTAKQRLAVLSGHYPLEGKNCLEVGCATGEFCKVLSDFGAIIEGIDLSGYAISTAKSRYPDLKFTQTNIENISMSGVYDAIFAFELIEHVTSPKDFLVKARNLLKIGGILALTTPNYGCVKEIGADRWIGFARSFEHIYFFSSDNLARLAQSIGFTTIAWYGGGDNGMTISGNSSSKTLF